ncbi:MAG: hypothetical protein NVS1B4_00170 [Gemmatimonadaceae bacterium]
MGLRGAARQSLPYIIAAAGGFLLAYLVVAFFIFPGDIIANDAPVPNVAGMRYDEAKGKLATAGFLSAQGEARYDATVPKGTVLHQNPAPGSRETRGMKVILDISSGQRIVIVPTVAGMTRGEAEARLETIGLDIGDVVQRQGDAPRGQVLETKPVAGTRVAPPGPIALIMSAGPAALTVPDVTGKPLVQARIMLDQLGLGVRNVEVDSTSVARAGVVVGQKPAAGAKAAGGGLVDLRISGRRK